MTDTAVEGGGVAEGGSAEALGEATYTFAAAARILDVEESKLRYWSQIGFVGPSIRSGSKQVYSFQDLVSVKAAKELTAHGVKPAQIRRALDKVREKLPHVGRPLDALRLAFDGETLVVLDGTGAYEPDGQKVFAFGLADLAERLARTPVDAPAVTPAPARAAAKKAPPERNAWAWFEEGTRLERAGGSIDEAAAAYQRALAADPGLAAAHTNLGNIAHRRGDGAAARAAFETALSLDPDQPEARFNLANLILEAGDLDLAVAELRRVLQLAPDFADAHYNLAVALERLGGKAQARAHLERYLGLEQDGPWVAEARRLVARLG